MNIRPKKLAAKYGLSANTLRSYEARGLMPPAERSANGYRMYTELHEAYAACIQAMAAAFGMEITNEVIRRLRRNELEDALWIVREKEVGLHREKESLDQMVRELKSYAETGQAYGYNRYFSIHEVSARTGAPKSAIRYWEKSGLFTTERNSDNQYRLYHEAHLLKIRMIQLLQSAVYSEETVDLKQSIARLAFENMEDAIKLSERIQAYLHKTIKRQMRAVYFLFRLLQAIGFEQTPDT